MPLGVVDTNAPISDSGIETLFIGLFTRDSSPVSVALMPRPEVNPINSLIPVPELPKSIALEELASAPLRLAILTLVPSIFIPAPIWLSAFAVESGSLPFKNPVMLISAFK